MAAKEVGVRSSPLMVKLSHLSNENTHGLLYVIGRSLNYLCSEKVKYYDEWLKQLFKENASCKKQTMQQKEQESTYPSLTMVATMMSIRGTAVDMGLRAVMAGMDMMTIWSTKWKQNNKMKIHRFSIQDLRYMLINNKDFLQIFNVVE